MKFHKIILFLSITISIIIFSYAAYRIALYGFSVLRITFIIVSVTSIIFLYLINKLSEELKTNISLSIFMFVIGLYIFNFFASSLILSEHDVNAERISIAKNNDIRFDERSRIEIISELNNSGVEAYPAFGPKEFIKSNGLQIGNKRIWPLGNISGKEIVLGNENGYWSIYKSDNLGFHNNSFVLKGQSIDALLIGDSAVEGSAVHTEMNFSGTLNNLGHSTVNLGRVGNGPNLNYAVLKEYIKYFKPKKILWFHVENDLNNIHVRKSEFQDSIIMRYINEENFIQGLAERQEEIDLVLKQYLDEKIDQKKNETKKNTLAIVKELILLNNIKEFVAYLLYASKIRSDSKYLETIEEYKDLLTKAKNLAEQNNAKFYFIYLPQWRSYGEANSYYWPLKYKTTLIDNVNSLDIPIIDIQNELDNLVDDPLSLWPFRTNGHMNEKGYKFVGETINKYLEIRN